MKMLVVDDNLAFVREVARLLARTRGPDGHTYEVTTETDHRAALKRLEKEYFDVVITDMRMAGPKDGMKILAGLAGKSTITIVLTDFPEVRNAVSCMRAGAWDYVSKGDKDPIERVLKSIRLAYRYRKENPDAGRTDPDARWLSDHLGELVARYPGEVVAVRYAKVLDHDERYGRLARRVRSKYPVSRPMMVSIPDPKVEAIE